MEKNVNHMPYIISHCSLFSLIIHYPHLFSSGVISRRTGEEIQIITIQEGIKPNVLTASPFVSLLHPNCNKWLTNLNKYLKSIIRLNLRVGLWIWADDLRVHLQRIHRGLEISFKVKAQSWFRKAYSNGCLHMMESFSTSESRLRHHKQLYRTC